MLEEKLRTGKETRGKARERVGEAIGKIARVLLRLPVCRYVDDYFSVERSVARVRACASTYVATCQAVDGAARAPVLPGIGSVVVR